MTLTIRPAVDDDVDELAELAAAAFRATYSPVVDVRTVEAVVEQACTAAAFRDLVRRASTAPDETLLVAVDDGVVLGFLDYGAEPEGFELRRLYARVGDTGRGVGAALLDHLERQLPSGARYRIVVLAANERGISFWTRHGFREIGRVDGIEHFVAHRGVEFPPAARAEPLVIMERVVD